MVSQKKLAANRRNARRSTGPRSAEGKARVAQNGTTHGIFCRSLVLAGESKEEFIEFREQMLQSLSPQDLIELALVDQIVSATWRLRRVQAAEQFLHQARAEQIEEAAEDEKLRLARVLLGNEDDEEDEDEGKLRQRQDCLAAISAGEITAAATLAIVCGDKDQSFERLSRYEQRLTGQIHRCLRDLEKLRQRKRRRLKFAPSPYSAEVQAAFETAESAAQKHTSKLETEVQAKPEAAEPAAQKCASKMKSKAKPSEPTESTVPARGYDEPDGLTSHRGDTINISTNSHKSDALSQREIAWLK